LLKVATNVFRVASCTNCGIEYYKEVRTLMVGTECSSYVNGWHRM